MSEQEKFFAEESEAYTDETLMPYGKHKGEKLGEVPDRYFLFLYEESEIKDKKLLAYVEENMDAIKKNVGR